ncbi:MAG TPA: helix-turn-helix domain-containing protein [Chloroflexota bacterium]|nr:helix-turn-helix domain-containing protein [Chloroflexota bacterium]
MTALGPPQLSLRTAEEEIASLQQTIGAIREALHATELRLHALYEALEVPQTLLPKSLPLIDPESPRQFAARRQALGLSQHALARTAHLSRGLIAEVERGQRRSAPTLAHIDATLRRLEERRGGRS